MRGFSLVELLVTLSIMTVVTGVVLTQFSNFDSTVVARARAYDVAQSIRIAQSYATRVRSASSTDTTFTLAYGVQFTRGSNSMPIFIYRGTGYPQYNTEAAALEFKTLPAGYTISSLCVDISDGTERCATSDGQTMSVAFRRPDIAALPYTSWYSATSSMVRARIGIRGPGTTFTHWVEVGKTGSITTKTVQTP